MKRRKLGRRTTAIVGNAILEVLEARRLLAAYSVVDIGALDPAHPNTAAYAMNDAGHAVGQSGVHDPVYGDDPSYLWHAFLYANGTIKDLGTLGTGERSTAYAINNLDEVVGVSDATSREANNNGDDPHAFIYRGGRMTDLQDLLPHDSLWQLHDALRINDHGLILARAYYDRDHTTDGSNDGTDDGTDDGSDDGSDDGTDDGSDDGTGDGSDDDGSGDGTGDDGGEELALSAVAADDDPDGPVDLDAFLNPAPQPGDEFLVLLDSHSGALTPIAHLDDPYRGIFDAYDYLSVDLNNAGQVVYGEATSPDTYQGLEYSSGHWVPIAPLPDDFLINHPVALNDAGDVVGDFPTATLNYYSEYHAWKSHAGHMFDLGTIDANSNADAIDVNDAGDVTGREWNEYNEPFLYHDGQTLLLNSLTPGSFHTHLDIPTALNNRGQILARTGLFASVGFENHSFILTPTVGGGNAGSDDVRPTVSFVSGSRITDRRAAATFTVHFQDDRAIDPASITGADFFVNYFSAIDRDGDGSPDYDGENGEIASVTVLSVTVDPDGRGATVLLRANPKSGIWNHNGDGIYRAYLGQSPFGHPNEHPLAIAADLASNHPFGIGLGQFTVDLPDTRHEFEHAADSAMAVDDAGNLHYAFFDPDAKTLKYAVRDPDFHWSDPVTVDPSGDEAQTLSLALDSAGRPAIAWWDASHADLKYAHFDGAAWTVETVDAYHATGGYPSLTFDASDHPAIAYWRKSSHDLRLARSPDGATWTIDVLDNASANTGRYPSLKLDPAAHRLALAWQDYAGKAFKYGSEQSDGAFDTTVVATTDDGGGWVSLAFNPMTNLPAFAYYDSGVVADRLAWFDGAAWQVRDTRDAGLARGYFNHLSFDSDGRATILNYHPKAFGLFATSAIPGEAFDNSRLLLNTQSQFSNTFAPGVGLVVSTHDRFGETDSVRVDEW